MTDVERDTRRTAGDDGGNGGTGRRGRWRTAGAQALREARPVDRVRREAAAVGQAVVAAWQSPGRERDLAVQSLKAAGAGLLAWAVAGVWLDDPMALMAPWVAVVLVQATVYSSVRQAGQQFGAICVGSLVASAAQAITDDNTGALALSLPLLMLLGNWARFGQQGVYAATTAVFVLASGTPVSASAVGHRVGQAALGAVIGIAVNAFVLPPIHLRDVRENLAALAREAGDVLHTIAGDLRENEWDAQTAAGWAGESARLQRRLEALASARSWSQESLRLTSGPLRALHRAPPPAPPEEEDQRWTRVTGNITALTRTLSVAADENRTPATPGGPVLGLYARLLKQIGDSCHTEAGRLLGEATGPHPSDAKDAQDTTEATEETMEELHRQLQDGLREHAGQGAAEASVLGALLLEAENLWADIGPEPRDQ
ncbi:FUSC family protein [Streptomyces sp. SCL15-6]|uniref:FUSC family protein n=1 Tax=Streptomyces sp. SCL15-6 TaxID=2967222 RepID=UPI0029666E1C|nr:FUSC family protein [Streptomyces sp. SCL15-6]